VAGELKVKAMADQTAIEGTDAAPQGSMRRAGHALASLDVLRGIAILAVLAAHFMPGSVPFERPLTIALGNFGVILFFFLSGFLMDQTFSRDPRLKAYAIRRSFRILPMYWLSIVLIFCWQSQWSVRDALANATFLTMPLHVTRMSGVYWTLYVEVMFYALVPLLWVAGARVSVASVYLLLAVYSIAWVAGVSITDAPFYVIYCLLGMQFGMRRRKIIGTTTLSLSVVAVAIGSSWLPIVSPYLGLAPLICSALVLIALEYPLRQHTLEWVGDVSYSLYLLHPIVGYWILYSLNSAGGSPWLSSIAGIAASFALSAVTFAMIERPIIDAGRRLIAAQAH
jgi:peptidoglycan/LPS O-acetylase OafA/YrhL